MVKGFGNVESFFKLSLLAFLLLLMVIGRSYPEKSRLFPELLITITILFVILSFIQGFIKPRGEKKKEQAKAPETPALDILEEKLRWVKEMEEKSGEDAGFKLLGESERRKRLWQSVLIILVSLGIGYLGGFLLTIPFYFITFGILHGPGKQALKYIIIGVGITVVIYGFFTTLMGVPLLRGLLWDF
jgi:hypothetical protein